MKNNGFLDELMIVDGCVFMFTSDDFPGATDRVAASGLNAFFLTVPHSSRGFREAARAIGQTYRIVDGQAGKLVVARSHRDLLAAANESKVAVILAFQDPAPIENSLELSPSHQEGLEG